MNILLFSHFFYPSVGGVETISEGLARAWQSRGHTVHVVTQTALEDHEPLKGLSVHRNPSFRQMTRLTREADVFVRSGHSLRSFFWPVLFKTPFLTIHHRPLKPRGNALRDSFEKLITHLGHNVAVSGPVADTIPGPTVRIPNTFRPIFDQVPDDTKDRQGLLFVGRLVSQKGADVALDALSLLRERGVHQSLTICGDGPEREALKWQAQNLGLDDSVYFQGWTNAESLAQLYSSSEVSLIPSREEAFGIVALESIASGCPVVASNVGGLPEAVGACGVLVGPEQPKRLADAIEKVLQPDVRETLRRSMPSHVARHRIGAIASEYLDLMTTLTRRMQ